MTMPQQFDARQLTLLTPHQGSMMLLDSVDAWDDEKIVCSAISHLSPENPLAVDGRVSYIQVIEYGAQAAAIHLALVAIKGNAPMVGYSKIAPVSSAYLAVTRNFSFERGFLSDHTGSRLILTSKVVLIGPRLYQYHVDGSIDGRTVAEGVISLVTDEHPE